jgi:hypothetical protein
VTVNSATAGNFNFNITGVGTDSSHIAHSVPASLNVNADFGITNGSGSQTVFAGQTATYLLTFAPIGSSTFGNTVTYSCSGAPAQASCSFSPPSLSGNSGTAVVTLSITTAGPNALHRKVSPLNRLLIPFGIFAFGLLLAGRISFGHRSVSCSISILLAMSLIMLACGGGSPGTSPSPVVRVQISPTSATLFGGQTQQFTATVTGSSNTQVNWNVNGVAGGNSTAGSVDGNGLYTAPPTSPGSAVTVAAVSVADSTKSSSANVTINSPTPTGAFPITVNAMMGGVQHYTILTLTVQ